MDRHDFLVGAGTLTLAHLVNGCIPFRVRKPSPERTVFMNTLRRRLVKSNRHQKPKLPEVVNALSSVERKVMGLSEQEFQKYKRAVHLAHRFANITNVQRYSQEVLSETVLNLTDPNYKKGKPLAVFVMAEYENPIPLKLKAKPSYLTSPNSPIFGIRPLDVKPSEVDKYMEGYKVVVFEAGNIWKIREQLSLVRGLYQGKSVVAGVSIGSHGTTEGFTLGARGNGRILVPDQVGFTFKPLKGMYIPEAIFVLPACYGGHGRTTRDNMANSFARNHPNHSVYACDKTTIWFDTSTDSNGKVDQNSISMIGIDNNGIGDCTYIVSSDEAGQLKETPHPSALKTLNGIINNLR